LLKHMLLDCKMADQAEFDRRRRARTLMVPTDDLQVKSMLRRCNEPICKFLGFSQYRQLVIFRFVWRKNFGQT
jgi:hypothetical protein